MATEEGEVVNRSRVEGDSPKEISGCPLKGISVPSLSPLVKMRVLEEPGGECCPGSPDFYNCWSYGFTIGSEVVTKNKVVKHVPEGAREVPKGARGRVVDWHKLNPIVEFQVADSASSLNVTVSPWHEVTAVNRAADSLWNCDCSAQCAKINNDITTLNKKTMAIADENDPPSVFSKIRVKADLDPKPTASFSLYSQEGKFNPMGYKYVLFLYPAEDHNGAFSMQKMLCSRIGCWAKRGYAVVMRTINGTAAGHKVLDMFEDKSIHHVILGAHGNEWGMGFGKGLSGALITYGPETQSFLKRVRDKLLLNGSLTLDACSTAGYSIFGNLFDWVAGHFAGRRVIGAKISLTDTMWVKDRGAECLAGDTVTFQKNGKQQSAVAMPGQPNCAEMGLHDITSSYGQVCKTRCGRTCADASEEWAKDGRSQALATLVQAEEEKDDRPGWCAGSSLNIRIKTVCRINQQTGA